MASQARCSAKYLTRRHPFENHWYPVLLKFKQTLPRSSNPNYWSFYFASAAAWFYVLQQSQQNKRPNQVVVLDLALPMQESPRETHLTPLLVDRSLVNSTGRYACSSPGVDWTRRIVHEDKNSSRRRSSANMLYILGRAI